METLEKFGYTWQGMKEVTKEEAEQNIKNGVNTYLLYPDNTESLIISLDELTTEGVRFGIEKPEQLLFKVSNSYHNTEEIYYGEDMEEVEKKLHDSLEITAENLTGQEIEEEWENYYKTYEEAWKATYNDILVQLKSEYTIEKM